MIMYHTLVVERTGIPELIFLVVSGCDNRGLGNLLSGEHVVIPVRVLWTGMSAGLDWRELVVVQKCLFELYVGVYVESRRTRCLQSHLGVFFRTRGLPLNTESGGRRRRNYIKEGGSKSSGYLYWHRPAGSWLL